MTTYEPVAGWELLRYRSARPGTLALSQAAVLMFGARGATNQGIYVRRRVRGGGAWSLHAVGRACDIGVPSRQVGAELAMRAIRGATKLGLCEVIWDRHRWTPEAGNRPYYGTDPHTSHVHLGQSRQGAAGGASRLELVRWYLVALATG